jgi:ABC-type branched-subunit amino acid transport system ATPase component
VTKRFGGLLAVSDATLDVAEGSITGLIGPNGAGKTTLFALVSGFEKPTAGLRAAGRARTSPAARRTSTARDGIARTFQIVQPFAGADGAREHRRRRLPARARRARRWRWPRRWRSARGPGGSSTSRPAT